MDIVLVGVFTTTLWRNIYDCSLEELEESLLYALATNVAGDGRVVGLACYLVYLVDKDYSTLRLSNVIVGYLQQSGEYALHVLSHVASFCEHSSIDDSKGNVEQTGYGTCQERLSRSCGTSHNDVALLYIHAVVVSGLLKTFVVVIYSHREIALGVVLTDDIFVEERLYLTRLRNLLKLCFFFFFTVCCFVGIRTKIYLIDLLDAVVANHSAKTCHQETYLTFSPTAEATYVFCHYFFFFNTSSIIPYSRASSAVIQ